MHKVFFLLAAWLCCQAAAAQPDPNFYDDRFRGWYWFEDPVVEQDSEPEPAPDTSPTQTPPAQPDKEWVALDVTWLREKFPEYRDAAINNPTRENIARFLYAQRYMLDISSRFSTKAMEFSELETPLHEAKRRPFSTFSLNVFKDETRQALSAVLDKVNARTHLWFFFTADCSYCRKQVPILKELAIRHQVNVLAVSMDGSMLPGLEEFEVVTDTSNVAGRFNVTYTPTILMALNDGSGFTLLGEGLTSLPDIQDRLLLASRMKGVINTQEYELTQGVREINVLTDSEGTMMADRQLLENDPGYLAELLRQKLADSIPVGAQTFNAVSGGQQ
ncbi:conjugal transfer protein TraF [Pseudoalteromonas rubra]|uniref:Conjugal transfer protein TraF n=1 Tax=Pseudoalteromonas rubra TaxID=43658 RepID=A0A0U2PGB2_9GAMM|nr:conjugal transfer protein TraF [Pseudoalteromonas rubra]ALU46141.1 hypothetical protein AT705_24575 [Pseudoalteromonas rubra]